MRQIRSVSTLGCLFGLLLLLGVASPVSAGVTYDVSIEKTHTGNFTVGQNGVFTITLQHEAGSSTSSLTFTITDQLPAGLTYVSDTGAGSGFTCNVNGQTVTCTGAPNLSVNNTSVSFTITVAVGNQAAPSVANTASFTAQSDNNADNNTDTDTVTVNAAAATASPSQSPTPTPSPSASPAAAEAEEENLPSTGRSAAPFAIGGALLSALGLLLFGRKRLARGSH